MADLNKETTMKTKLLKMLAEPSTYAGFAALALTLGVAVEEYTAYTTALAALFALVAVAKGESSE